MALAPGGPAASTYWLLKLIARIYLHFILMLRLTPAPVPLPAGLKLIALRSYPDLHQLSENVITGLDAQCGVGVKELLSSGHRMYALLSGEEPVCQLNIGLNDITVYTPIKLRVMVGAHDCFLSFLYTDPAWRGRNLAKALIALACSDLASNGWHRCVCHVRSTNVPSLRAFKRNGWRSIGVLATTTGGRMIAALGFSKSGIRLESAASKTRG